MRIIMPITFLSLHKLSMHAFEGIIIFNYTGCTKCSINLEQKRQSKSKLHFCSPDLNDYVILKKMSIVKLIMLNSILFQSPSDLLYTAAFDSLSSLLLRKRDLFEYQRGFVWFSRMWGPQLQNWTVSFFNSLLIYGSNFI